jgi:CBS domain-containing protein
VLDYGKLVGIVTLGDVREAEPSDATTLSIWEINYLLAKIQVRELMTPMPKTVLPTDSLGHAARIMLEEKVGGLPVVTVSGDLVGIITESDIFRAVVQNWEEAGEMMPA